MTAMDNQEDSKLSSCVYSPRSIASNFFSAAADAIMSPMRRSTQLGAYIKLSDTKMAMLGRDSALTKTTPEIIVYKPNNMVSYTADVVLDKKMSRFDLLYKVRYENPQRFVND